MKVNIITPAVAENKIDCDLVELTKIIWEKHHKDESYGFGLGGEFGYGADFNNEIFVMRRYYWGDCTCGFDNADYKWSEENHHTEFCYQSKLKQIEKEWAIKKGELKDFERFNHFSEYSLPDKEKKQFSNQVKALCKKLNLTYPDGCAIHCTCENQKNYENWRKVNGHKKDCPTIQHNFEHFKSGFTVDWYKWIGRDSQYNKKLTLKEWLKIFNECLESI